MPTSREFFANLKNLGHRKWHNRKDPVEQNRQRYTNLMNVEPPNYELALCYLRSWEMAIDNAKLYLTEEFKAHRAEARYTYVNDQYKQLKEQQDRLKILNPPIQPPEMKYQESKIEVIPLNEFLGKKTGCCGCMSSLWKKKKKRLNPEQESLLREWINSSP